MMNRCLSIAAIAAGLTTAYSADPQEVWEQAVQAKGGRERLHSVHSLAIYMKPAPVNLAGPPANWLCAFPDRYFEYSRVDTGNRAMVVDGTAGRAAMDETGRPRHARQLSSSEQDQLVLNQLVFLLESAWLQPQPVEVRHNVLVVEAAGRTYKLFLNGAGLPERVLSLPMPSEKRKAIYDYRLQRYRESQGVQLPMRVASISGMREEVWDVDYELDAKFNPKMFERMPDLADGPEPWRKR
jgi:hypothetical protein